MQEGNTGSAPSLTSMQNYLRIAEESPGYGLAVLGVFLGFVAPFLLFMLADDVLGIGSFCGGLLLIGTVMVVVSISKHSSWRKTYNARTPVLSLLWTETGKPLRQPSPSLLGLFLAIYKASCSSWAVFLRWCFWCFTNGIRCETEPLTRH